MKHLLFFLVFVLLISYLAGCSAPNPDIACTTAPVYEFTRLLSQGTGLSVTRLITENVSCLHDYTLQTQQLRAIQGASVLVISGAGLEDFLSDALSSANTVIDSSQGIHLLESCHEHAHEGHHHHHDDDPHFWLSPVCAKAMAQNICQGLEKAYPDHSGTFRTNLTSLLARLDDLQKAGEAALRTLSTRQLITFHDGFSYLADSFGLEILAAVEEESGSEASAQQLIALIRLTREQKITAIFTETNGADAAAGIISRETGLPVYTLDMAMGNTGYFDAMYQNIHVLQEALS